MGGGWGRVWWDGGGGGGGGGGGMEGEVVELEVGDEYGELCGILWLISCNKSPIPWRSYV